MESFTPEEHARLAPFFTNTDSPVFGLTNLPEVLKGALFARYSRTAKTLRRLFLDEFLQGPDEVIVEAGNLLAREGVDSAHARARQLYDRVFTEYGDDSVAQLGAAHIACEGVSNVLTKLLERGRLASYLEQSTRYILFDQKQEGRWCYLVPGEIAQSGLRREYVETMDNLFEVYSTIVHDLIKTFGSNLARPPGVSDAVWRSTIRSKACDVARGLLPASTQANVGIFASGQSYELLLFKLLTSRMGEARDCGRSILAELQKMIPSFVRRVEMPERGGAWMEYLKAIPDRLQAQSDIAVPDDSKSDAVTLVDWDPDGEAKVIAAILFEYGQCSSEAAEKWVAGLSADRRRSIFEAYVGERKNRRHRPGRALERTYYKFDCVSDYGAFRDLQRHRILTIEWQKLDTHLGYVTPTELGDQARQAWIDVMERAGRLHAKLTAAHGVDIGQYCIPFAYRIRYTFQLNARSAMHMIELRTQPQGHPSYRKLCAQMLKLIAGKAGHTMIAHAFQFANLDDIELGRLDAEKKAEARSQGTKSILT